MSLVELRTELERERGVRGVPDQQVAELVRESAGRADQLLSREQVEQPIDGDLRQRDGGVARERPTDDRHAREQLALVVREVLEPCREQRLDRRRQLDDLALLEAPARVAGKELRRVAQARHELLEEERVARPGVDERRQRGRLDRGRLEEIGHQPGAGGAVERAELDDRGRRAVGRRRPRRRDHEERAAR